MWTLEDLQELNPPDGRQEMSFLSRLMEIGATTPKLLSEVAERLESTDGPFVAAIAQLPFDLGLGTTEIVAPGDVPDVKVQLLIRPCILSVDGLGRAKIAGSSAADIETSTTTVTHVVGLVRLGEKRARIHETYKGRLGRLRSLDQPLGDHKIEGWMLLPQAKLVEPVRRKSPLTGRDFQREVASRARQHLLYATNAALRVYSVANLEEVPPTEILYGYHLMIAPGRITCATAPIPVIAGLLPPSRTKHAEPVSESGTFDVIGSALRLEDTVLRQLQAMNRLLQSGEASLALIGCVTAVEWFLDARFPDLGRTTRGGSRRSASVSTFLKSDHATLIEPDDHKLLERVVAARNEIAHGAPPTRGRTKPPDGANAEFVRSALFVALRLYRVVNLHTQASRGAYMSTMPSRPSPEHL